MATDKQGRLKTKQNKNSFSKSSCILPIIFVYLFQKCYAKLRHLCIRNLYNVYMIAIAIRGSEIMGYEITH